MGSRWLNEGINVSAYQNDGATDIGDGVSEDVDLDEFGGDGKW